MNDHARLDAACEAEAGRIGASLRLLGGGQMCFRGGEISESAEIDDEDEASLLIVLRNGAAATTAARRCRGWTPSSSGRWCVGRIPCTTYSYPERSRGRGRNDGAGIGA